MGERPDAKKDTGSAAIRDGYGMGLLEICNDSKVVALDADLSGSTRSKKFQGQCPNRFVNVGIAEQNLMTVAAGLAAVGKIPFASTFAMFVLRGFEQIRNSICYSNLNVKICGSHAGIVTGEDGATHQCIEDMAVLRAVPNMTVICPGDAYEAKKATIAAYKHVGPVYIRTSRAKVKNIYDDNYKFQIGKASQLKDGTDITIIACGAVLGDALEAAEQLDSEGISTAVINMASIKPIDKEAILTAADKSKAIVTCEDHSIIGGLGGAVAEVLAGNSDAAFLRIGVKDTFGESGKPDELKAKYEINTEAIFKKTKSLYENLK